MQFQCSHCHTRYSLSEKEARSLPDSVMSCRQCDRNIKITFCPSCNAFYSITFDSTEYQKYRFSCKRCGTPFVVSFNSVYMKSKDYSNEKNSPTADTVVKERVHKKEKQKETVKARQKKTNYEKVSLQEKEKVKEEPVLKGQHLNGFTLHEWFGIAASAFSPPALFRSLPGALLILLITYITGTTMPESVYNHTWLGWLSRVLPFFLMYGAYLVTAVLVGRYEIHRVFGISMSDDNPVLFDAFKSFGMVILFSLLAVFLLMALGWIPGLGPSLFAVALLPLYSGGVLLAAAMVVMFWFYPPLLAHRGSQGPVMKNIFHFIRKHGTSIIPSLAMLFLVVSTLTGVLLLLHSSVLALLLQVSAGSVAGGREALFASVPSVVSPVVELSFLAGKSPLGQLQEGLSLASRTGGLIIAVALSIVSFLFIAVWLSLNAVIATHVYVYLERGVESDDSHKFRAVLLLLLILTALALVRYIFH